MARNATLQELRILARRYADMVHSTFVDEVEVNDYINASYAELYTLLVQSGCDYFWDSEDIAVTSATDTYPLPDDFMALRGVDVDFGDGPYEALPYVFAERNFYPATDSSAGSYTATIHYYPNPPKMVGDTDAIDGVAGWEEYVALGAAIKCLQKEESDTRDLQVRQQAKLMEIQGAAGQRDAGHPDRVTDVESLRWQRGCVKYRLWGSGSIRFMAYAGMAA